VLAWESAVTTLLDPNRPLPEREFAAVSLGGEVSNPTVVDALLKIACDKDSPERLQSATARSLAKAFLRAGRLLDAPLEEFTGIAFDAFDQEVTESQRKGS